MKFFACRALWQRRRVRIAVKAAVGGMLGLILVGFVAVPPLLRWVVESQGSRALGRPVMVQAVSFNPLTLSARIEGLRILEADGSRAFFSLDRLRANLSTASIWQRGAVFDGLRIEHPAVHVVRLTDNRFNFSDILERLATAPEPADKPASGPARFAINNLELVDGQIEFDDRPVKRLHKVERLNLRVPFISSLPAKVETFAQPKLEGTLNGSAFRLVGEVKPFADHHREASLTLGFAPFDVTPYLGYVPVKLPVEIVRGKFGSDLRVRWVEGNGKTPGSLVLSGRLELSGVSLKDGQGAALFDLAALGVEIEHLEPLATPPLVRFKEIRAEAPGVELRRGKDGILNFARLAAAPGRTPPASGGKSETVQLAVAKLIVTKGRVHWHDEAVAGGYDFTLNPLDVRLDGFDLAAKQPAALQLKAQGDKGETLAVSAKLGVAAARHEGHLTVAGVGLAALRPYYAAFVGRALLQGKVGAESDFAVAPGESGPAVRFDKLAVSLTDFALRAPDGAPAPAAVTAAAAGEGGALIRLPETRLADASIDLAKQELTLGRFASRDARLRVLRDKDGALDLLRLLQAKERSDGHPPAAAPRDATVHDAPAPWRIKLGEAALTNWALHFEDRSGSVPVALEIADFGLKLRDWSNQAGAQARAELAARVNKAGRVAIDGHFGVEPLKGALRLDLRAVDFLAVQPYVDELYRVLVTRGNVSARGNLDFDLSRVGKPDIRYAGSLAVDDFNSLDRLNDADFMRWKHFALTGVKVQTQPLAFATREVRLADFYTRLILDAQGRLNVRELAADETDPLAGGPAVAAASAPVAAAQAVAWPQVKIERIVLANGHVNYTDRFIKPNYEANLLGLNGTLNGLSSDPASVAALDLKASMDGAAPVTVAGELNPFRKDSFLDVRAAVRDVDLTGVATYSAKYVGYGIDKGKLSMDVHYKIRDRQLAAENRVMLDQLTFGDKVDSPDATKLPVLFAVSLLKDRHGVIDIKLPIAGSLDDPQFSVGGIILKVIGNLIGKAVTAPFSLIGSMFGGGEELAYLDFAAGSAAIPAAGDEKVLSLAKALADRPALRLEIAGRADPAADATGLKRARLDARLRALKAERMVKRGEAVGEVEALKIEAAEYPALLKSVYETEKIDGRPRNALGLLRSLPVEEMEKIVLASYLINPADLQALATQRAQAVRARLLEQAGVSPERVFLIAAASASERAEGQAAASRVEFSLR